MISLNRKSRLKLGRPMKPIQAFAIQANSGTRTAQRNGLLRAYADQNSRDYAALQDAVTSGVVAVQTGV